MFMTMGILVLTDMIFLTLAGMGIFLIGISLGAKLMEYWQKKDAAEMAKIK